MFASSKSVHPWSAVTVLALLLVSAAQLSAQRLSISGGYSSMPGRIGSRESDRGPLLRVGVDLRTASRLSWTIEGQMERHNESRRTSTSTCVLPGGGNGNCHFTSSDRDNTWSLGSVLRYEVASGAVRPYALAGVGMLWVRTKGSTVAVDDAGTVLTNFSYDGSSTDGAAQLHLGGGVSVRPEGFPVTVLVEARATRLLYNYSGGLQWGWNPTIVVGIRH